MVIYMEDYRKAQSSSVVKDAGYNEELLCANWNPALQAFAMSCFQTAAELSPQLPEDFSNIDVEAFLDRIYALATQV
ncbi:MAG TPA: hypothetical protein VKF40_30020 [Burkholderiales bacterium]|nr:hypothetical protein [Burkholderiales bacterium]